MMRRMDHHTRAKPSVRHSGRCGRRSRPGTSRPPVDQCGVYGDLPTKARCRSVRERVGRMNSGGGPVTAVPERLSDATLIAAVRLGDTHAYGLLYERHLAAANRAASYL